MNLLTSQLAKGNTLMFDVLFETYYPRMLHFVLPFCKDEQIAEDVVQDIFLNLWLKRERLAEVHDLEAYFLPSLAMQHRAKPKACDKQLAQVK